MHIYVHISIYLYIFLLEVELPVQTWGPWVASTLPNMLGDVRLQSDASTLLCAIGFWQHGEEGKSIPLPKMEKPRFGRISHLSPPWPVPSCAGRLLRVLWAG